MMTGILIFKLGEGRECWGDFCNFATMAYGLIGAGIGFYAGAGWGMAHATERWRRVYPP